MYRIRRESGEEVTLGSIDEFGAAVAAGIVTAKAEIFHARAEKWLPIASHPHFKMASDRINAAANAKAQPRTPAVTASGQRPAIGSTAQRPTAPVAQASAPSAAPVAQRTTAPQLRVMRPEATSPAAPAGETDAAVTQKPAPRWNTGQRPAARTVAPKPSAPAAPPVGDLRLVRADALISTAATAPALPEIEFELLPEIVAPEVIEPVAEAPAVAEPVAAAPAAPAAIEPVAQPPQPVADTVVERTPANVELVSHEEKPAASRGEVEIINPDRTMPVVSDREDSALDIPAPIRDFSPAEEHTEPPAAPKKSSMPMFVGIGLVAAAAAVIGFFMMKPSSPSGAPAAPSKPEQSAPVPVAAAPAPAPAPSTAAPTPPTGSSTGLGGDVQVKKPKKQADVAQASDGLEPPPDEVIPAAPTVGKIGGDAAALPTVDAGTVRNDAMDREKALERTRRQIDSSMRQ